MTWPAAIFAFWALGALYGALGLVIRKALAE